MPDRKRIGVVLFQLGGPDSLEAVEPFLYNLFCDPDIIDFPLGGLLRKPLAKVIAMRRAQHVAEDYAKIGNRSPILQLTQRQATALEAALQPHADAHVVMAMRYWHPFTREAVKELSGKSLDEIVLLPLYPQYSIATTGSSFNEWERCYTTKGIPVRRIEQFFDHTLYLDAFVELINTSGRHFLPRAEKPLQTEEDVHLVFSAHGLPVSFVERGDPYQKQVEETVRLLMARGGWKNAHTLCYQSKVGKQEWLEPSLHDTIERLGHAGTKQMLVIPVAFVSEHIETLYEINIEAREEATHYGIEQFEMVPALGDSPKFIAALVDLVLRACGLAATSQTASK